MVGLGTALQGIPELVSGDSGLLLAAIGLLGTATAVTAQVLLERPERAPEAGDRPALRRRLPPPVDHFTGHEALMAELLEQFERFPRPGPRGLLRRGLGRVPGGRSRSPLVLAITGEGGTGKSQLVAQIVDRVADRFPDGKLEFELYGVTEQGPSGRREPRRPEDVLAQMAAELGGRPADGASQDELSGLWKTATEERRLLVVLDNAKDYAQVRPLLPSGRGCAVLITGRTGFTDAEQPMLQRRLGPLSPEESLELVDRLVGASGRELTAGDRDALPDLVEACHGLPLALCLAGTQLTLEDGPSVRTLLDRMRKLDVPGPRAVARSLAFSLQQCEPGERLLLSRLAGAGLTTFTAWAAAALLDTGEDDAGRMLVRMSHRYLVTYLYRAGGFDRFQLHDRVRDTLLLAGPHVLGVPEEERADWSAEELRAAVDRLLGAFERVAEAAARGAAPHEWNFGAPVPGRDRASAGPSAAVRGPAAAPGPSAGPEPAAVPVPPAGPDRRADAPVAVPAPTDGLAWLDSERRGFEVCFRWTAPERDGRRSPAHGWRLRRAFTVLSRTGRTHWGAVREATKEATELALEMADPFAYGVALLDRAEVAGGQGDHETGYERALTALHVLEQLDPPVDPRWSARAHRAVGVNLYRRGDLDDGRAEIERAVRIFEEHEDRWWWARTLCNLAEVDRFQGHLERAYALLSQAEKLLVGSRDVPEQWARVQLQRGEVLRLRGYTLNAWFVLADGLEQLSTAPKENWYRARYLRSLGQLSTNELNREAWACELLLGPGHERERRRLTARDPGWPRRQLAKVTGLFVEGSQEYAHRCAEPGPSRGPLRGRRMLRDTWQGERQIDRLREAERAFEEIGDDWGRWRTCLVLGQALLAADGGRGKEEFLRAARGFRELGDKWWHARAHRMAAESLQRVGRLTEAEELARVAIEGYRGLQHRSGQLRAMRLLAGIVSRRDLLEAWRILNRAEELAEEGVLSGVVPESLLVEVRDMLRVIEHGSDSALPGGPVGRAEPPGLRAAAVEEQGSENPR
ncbi:NB-ARC domain-containing protein [Nocardiopsis ganjiahuensis]|uniref:NB-ARC domain-containing protein n=1 Tax=Nocardiopsis ganjiahuensis TaxID=239984 RepID=UPI001EF9E430|nr:NB-ARC domain-containing protein [Nocardiopsis ganjiahuensis]